MPRTPRSLPALLLSAVLLLCACASDPAITEPPATATADPSAEPSPSVSEAPFRTAAWPATGSACDTEGYTGRMGRIEAVDVRTIRFSLCQPDGAFLARIADPALGIIDTATLDRLVADRAAARSLPGTGPYRIDRWDDGESVILVTAGEPQGEGASTPGLTPTLVLRWASDPSQRTFELQSATVDGIDAPGALDLDRIATLPELSVTTRTGLSTAYLAFGAEKAFNDPRVRRAIAAGLDREALATAAFPAGSAVAGHVTPCVVPGGCGGEPWPEFNGPAAAAELAAAGFDLSETYTLHVANRAGAGLPDPVAAAEAIRVQLAENLGLQVVIDVMTPRDLADEAAAGSLDGLYLAGVGSTIADPVAYLGPLFGNGLKSTPAKRATGVRDALVEAAASTDASVRAAAVARANDAIRDAVPLIPLVSPGALVAFRTDVSGVVASPLGIDPLGSFTPGDRRQLVFMQSTEPDGAYCGDQRAADALRLCALVTEPLYGFVAGTLETEPRLAERCTPNDDATVWTCRLRAAVAFHDGAVLDAGDVLASYVAQWDESQPVRTAQPEAAFAAWTTLFGESIGSPAAESSPAP